MPRNNLTPAQDQNAMGQVERTNLLREQEKERADAEFEARAEQAAKENAPYAEENDYSFLSMTPKVSLNNETNFPCRQAFAAKARVYAPKKGGRAGTCMSL